MPELYKAKSTKNKAEPVSLKLEGSHNLLASFVTRPKSINFESQKDDETILLLVRKHWLTNFPWIFFGLVLLVVPIIFRNFPAIALLPIKFQIFVFIGWYLIVLAYFFDRFLDWFFNVGIITDQRVIDIDFYGLLYKEISDAELSKIQDVTQKVVGAIRTVFDFGNVVIQTAGEKAMLEFEDIPHPDRVVKLLQDLNS